MSERRKMGSALAEEVMTATSATLEEVEEDGYLGWMEFKTVLKLLYS